MQFKDYYETLGVSQTATAAEIKSAYRKLARKFHPDVSKEAQAEDRFKAINEAYEALRDDEKRKAYDQLRAQGYRPGQEFRPPPGFGAEFRFDPDQDAGSGFSDFFESLFGRARTGPQQRTQRSAEKARVDVELATVFNGGTQRVSVRGKLLEVRIPRGIAVGQNIRLAAQGHQGADLLLEIHYRAHPQFSVEGRDLTCRVNLKPWDAGLGCEVKVPTLAGEVNLRIPPGTSSGRKLRLRGRGLPGQGEGDAAGDQFVEVMVEAPAATDDAQTAAYQKLKESFGG